MKTKQPKNANQPEAVPADIAASISEIVEYLWDDEQRHCLDCNPKGQTGHIFESLANVRRWLESQ